MKIQKKEKQIINNNFTLIGIDEVGRGAIFGPVAICATAIKDIFLYDKRIKDSKKILSNTRNKILKDWQDKINWKVEYAFPKTGLNEAFYECANKLKNFIGKQQNPYLLVDNGLKRFFNYKNIEEIIKGDNTYFCIALASIFAKVKRDNLLIKYSKKEKYLFYDLQNNKGYTSDIHIEAIRKYGISDLHRKFYSNLREFIV